MVVKSKILSVKITVPTVRDDIIERHHLRSKIPSQLQTVTLICASSGYGKTSFLLQYLQQVRLPVLWYSVDEADNHIARFWTYLVATFAGQEQWQHISLNEFEPETESELREGISALINIVQEHPENQEYVLVFEDWHLIENPLIERALAFLVQNCPRNLKLIISSRIDPDLPLSRLRVSGNLLEIREAQLRFSREETGEFLQKRFSLRLDDDLLAMLHEKTEGWIAGIQLAAIGLQASSDIETFMRRFAGTNRYIMDYLLEVAFTGQSEEIKSFLLQTSILERMTPGLCNAVCEIEDSPAIFSELEQKRLFLVALDNERQWYRYHHLFGDLLHQRLINSSMNIAQLHHRASLWYMNVESNGSSLEFTRLAIHHALHSENEQFFLATLEELAPVLWRQNQHDILFEAIDTVPDDSLQEHPTLLFYSAWRFVTSANQSDAAQLQFEQAEKHPIDRELQGRIASARATLGIFKNDLETTIAESKKALSLLAEDDPWYSNASISMGDAYAISGFPAQAADAYERALQSSRQTGSILMRLNAGFKLAGVQRQQGQIKEAFSTCNAFIEEAHEHQLQKSAGAGVLYGLRGDILAEWRRFDDATTDIQIAMDCNERRDYIGFYGWANLYYARLLQAEARFDEALDHLQMIMQTTGLPPWLGLPYQLTRVLIWIDDGNLHSATTWLDQQNLAADHLQSPRFDGFNLSIARILIAQGNYTDANAIIERVIDSAEKSQRSQSVMIGYIILALSHQRAARHDEAQTALTAAIEIGQSGDYLQTFVNGGRDMIAILLKIREDKRYTDYVNYILNAFPDLPQSLIEPLSERELEILRLIASGMKNQQIADELVISINTVLYHTKNIYGKLGVSRRTQAVQKASQLNII